MKLSIPLAWILSLASICTGQTSSTELRNKQPRLSRRDHSSYAYYALHLEPSLIEPQDVALWLGGKYEGQVGELADHHEFSFSKEREPQLARKLQELDLRRRRRRGMTEVPQDPVLWSSKLELRPPWKKRIVPPPVRSRDAVHSRADQEDSKALDRRKAIAEKLQIHDPGFRNQWHIYNTYQVGHDLNITSLWLDGIIGNSSIATAIVDDGLDMNSEDLKANYFAAGSYDFNNKVPEPKPRLKDDQHGTRCAGEVAAVRNDVCGLGLAYGTKVSGIRILSGDISNADEAAAINYGYQENSIYSCSWGPTDDGATMEAPNTLVKRAIVNGVQKGRGGKGSIFVFAAGNGALHEDNCNFDGYTNSIYSVTVGAIDRFDNHPYYSESCSAQLVVAYSSSRSGAIYTTDTNSGSACTDRHGGTSAAGPLMAGVVALLLSVRPDLTWRDVQYLVVETAVPFNLDQHDWQTTAIGKRFSHEFGYGKLDAYALVNRAKTWELVKPQAWLHSPWLTVNHDIPQGAIGLGSVFEVTEDMLKKNNIERLEHVTITMNVSHTRRGDLSVELKSPTGVVSHLSTPRSKDVEPSGYDNWTFMTVAHWGEIGIGNWTIVVKDTKVNEHTGRFMDWQLNIWGEAINSRKQRLHPLPTEADHAHAPNDGEQAEVITTSVDLHPTGAPTTNPSDHPHRPAKPKPTSTTAATSTMGADDKFLPSLFPTFGVSKSTQAWIYGSLSLIIVFCGCLGAYMYIQHRRRIRNNPRDDYEFEIIDEGDEDGGDSSDEDAAGKEASALRRKRRGGELYDAFAEESDDELLSDNGDARSHSSHTRYNDEDNPHSAH